ncbi:MULTISPECIES: type II toxin-antitoxin system Phd/YefM family antitoxin [Saccharothrix]|uniref:type II toxin-antitoxin system Phd/YefM family antitoxin n=1 Tax=Saccharothrix TaxID=2071 RepID=UPI00093CD43D|nr:type II toxin-antitoxin system prevent-host-death family antitoxin [Saccharothrix sp. CB00851]OKI18223.1 prevent-host-death protein [Saccharothrix sp. CB00851]
MGEPSTIGVRELNQRTSAVLKRVRGGERITVTEHGEPVAYLVPVQSDADVLDRLVAAGQAIVPSRTGALVMPPDWGDADVDVAAELVAARDEERW